jgi:hypothetical protein
MKRLLVLVVLLGFGLALAEDVGVQTVTERQSDGTEMSHQVIYTGTEHITLDQHGVAPARYPSDTGELWVDRNHRFGIVYGLAIQGDGMGIFAHWDLNAQRVDYYRTLGDGVPAWEKMAINNYGSDGHQLGASRHGEVLAIAGREHCDEWTKTSGVPRWRFPHPAPFSLARTNSYATVVAVAASNGTLYVLGAETGETLWTAAFSEGARLQGLSLSCDGSVVAVTVYDSCFIFENGVRRGAIPIGTTSSGTQYAAKLNTDGKYLVTGDYFGRVRLYRWSGTTYDMMWSASVGNPWVNDVAISKDGSTIACGTGYANGKAVLFDSSSATPLWSFQGFGNVGAMVASCALSRDGSKVVFASWGDTAQSGSTYCMAVFDRSSSTPLCGIQRDEEVGSLFACDISGDGQYVTAGGKAVHAYRMGNGGQVYSFLVGHTPPTNVGVSSITEPGPYLQLGQVITPACMVRNYGDVSATFDAHLSIRTPQGEVWTGSLTIVGLAPQAEMPATFPNFNLTAYNYYDFTYWTAMPDDSFPGDDTLIMNSRCFHDANPEMVSPPFAEMTVGYQFTPIVKVRNSGSYEDNFAVTLTILDSAGSPVAEWNEVQGPVAPGESAMVTMSSQWAAEFTGRYTARAVARAETADFEPGNDTLGRGFLGTLEILYDDGYADAYYWVGRLNNDKFFCQFTPTLVPPLTLTSGRIWINTANQPFAYVALCKDAGGRPDTAAELVRIPDVQASSAPDWATFDLGVTLMDPSPVWMVINWYDNSTAIGIGADANLPRDYRSAWMSNQDTFRIWTTHDWMMRITQEPGAGIAAPGTLPARRHSLGRIQPNPCAGTALVRYALAGTSRVSIQVVDPTGRIVRTLVSGRQPAGDYAARWNGLSDAGHPAAPGIYFCRMTALDGNFSASRKLVLSR